VLYMFLLQDQGELLLLLRPNLLLHHFRYH
jgi:hypothetical protein